MNDMRQIATDVVLLPDETMMDRAIEINGGLIRDYRPEIALNRQTCLPHISLAMGCIEQQDIDNVARVLERLARRTPIRQLRIVGLLTPGNSQGTTTSLLEVERTRELQQLHEDVMTEMASFFSDDVTDAMIHDDVVAPSTLDWIRNYADKSSYQGFHPHITLGYGDAKTDMDFPFLFDVTRLAICHLGNHCTCRKILASASLA